MCIPNYRLAGFRPYRGRGYPSPRLIAGVMRVSTPQVGLDEFGLTFTLLPIMERGDRRWDGGRFHFQTLNCSRGITVVLRMRRSAVNIVTAMTRPSLPGASDALR